MLNDFYAEERPSGYKLASDQETRMLTDLKNVYKVCTGEVFKPKA
jgi:hypothetical protein